MNSACLEPTDLDRLGDSPDARTHAEECPRCHELLESYRSFMATELKEGSNAEDAELRLGDFLESLLAPRPKTRPRLLRPVGWTVAAAAAVTLFFVWPRGTELVDTPVLRDQGATPLGLQAPVVLEGSWRLRWGAVDAADAYEVRLYTTGLDELRRIGPMTETEVLVDFPDEETATLLWRVIALRGGDEIERSAVGTLSERTP